MAQATQVFSTGSFLYTWIDNAPAGNLVGVSSVAGAPGYDNIIPPGAVAHATIPTAGANGFLPDFVNAQTTILNNPAAGGVRLLYKNPS